MIPSLARSMARVLKRPATPGRMPLERTRPSTGCFTEVDWMARMRPHCLAFMPGRTSRMRRTVDRCTCSKACSHWASVIFSKGPGGGPPTLATSTSTPPHASRARATARAQSSAFARSAGIASTSAPVLRSTSAAASLRAASPRAHMATRAPSAASPIAHALPIPLLAAATNATLPLSPRSMLSPQRASRACLSSPSTGIAAMAASSR